MKFKLNISRLQRGVEAWDILDGLGQPVGLVNMVDKFLKLRVHV
jgi:hypothetical protein